LQSKKIIHSAFRRDVSSPYNDIEGFSTFDAYEWVNFIKKPQVAG